MGLASSVVTTLIQDDLFQTGAVSASAEAVLLAAFLCGHVPVTATTACLVPFLPDPAAALNLGRHPPCHMNLQCSGLVAACLQGVLRAACICQPSSAPALASLRLADRSSVTPWLLCMQPGSVFTPELLPMYDFGLHLYAPVHRGAVVDARRGLL